MNNEENTGFTMKVETPNSSATYTFPNSDVGMDELCNAFFSMMIGVTFMPTTVLEGMRDFAEKQLAVISDE